jgi:SPP1 gp7 family putative phage head morphogenesis protein
MVVATIKPLPFDEAIADYRKRAGTLFESDRWTDVNAQQHRVGFTVARSAGFDILGDISAALDKAQAEGQTLEQFSKGLVPLLKQKGWWGKSEEADGSMVQLGSDARLKTIFNMNMRMAWAVGRWEVIQRTKRAMPYLRYSAILDVRTRPAHRAWDGTVLSADDPWWDVHFPPCGWNCRCSVRQVTRLEATKVGITAKPPTGPPKKWTNPSTGETIEVPYGISPGFGQNPGKLAMQMKDAEAQAAARELGPKLIATPPRVAAEPLPSQILADQTAEFARWIDGIDTAKPKGEMRVAGALPVKALDFLSAPEIAKTPESGAITVTDHAIAHMLRDSKGARAPLASVLARLPELMARPAAILWDKDKQNLVWVIEIAGQRGTRLVVELDRAEKSRDQQGNRQTITTNSIVNGQLVDVASLGDRRRYQLIDGEL